MNCFMLGVREKFGPVNRNASTAPGTVWRIIPFLGAGPGAGPEPSSSTLQPGWGRDSTVASA
jgi:hypothetical protein